jgi:predicted phage tail protein
VLATKEPLEPNHAGNVGGKSVWWSWTAPASGGMTIDTATSNFDTLLAVYTGTAVGSLLRIAANDDAPNLLTSKVTFTAVAGQTYQIAVDGYNGASGTIALRVQANAATPTNVNASDGTFTDRVRVTWSAAAGASAYEVWRGTKNSSSSATKISLSDVTGTTFDDTTAVAGKTYWYFVRAKNAVGTSAFSAGNTGYRAVATFSAATKSTSSSTKLLSFGTTPIILDDLSTL